MATRPRKELRVHPIRRQFNEAFCNPDGQFSITKFMAVWAQIAILAHFNIWFEKLIDKPESLLIIILALIAPDLLKKYLSMKLGTK